MIRGGEREGARELGEREEGNWLHFLCERLAPKIPREQVGSSALTGNQALEIMINPGKFG